MPSDLERLAERLRMLAQQLEQRRQEVPAVCAQARQAATMLAGSGRDPDTQALVGRFQRIAVQQAAAVAHLDRARSALNQLAGALVSGMAGGSDLSSRPAGAPDPPGSPDVPDGGAAADPPALKSYVDDRPVQVPDEARDGRTGEPGESRRPDGADDPDRAGQPAAQRSDEREPDGAGPGGADIRKPPPVDATSPADQPRATDPAPPDDRPSADPAADRGRSPAGDQRQPGEPAPVADHRTPDSDRRPAGEQPAGEPAAHGDQPMGREREPGQPTGREREPGEPTTKAGRPPDDGPPPADGDQAPPADRPRPSESDGGPPETVPTARNEPR